ncbi:type II toxin-antitoxin system RelE/ParE family toxin [Candidatus Micrarchaeota archaeon]|nr:type II toxin-antitoxin system RelE/ParE family toxin [Candidatus Micrarchaeota archaeon]
MAYAIKLSEESLSALRKIDTSSVKRIISKLEQAAENPAHFFERLVDREEYKLRVGDYRILSRVLHQERLIFIYSIGHRKNIYK